MHNAALMAVGLTAASIVYLVGFLHGWKERDRTL